MGCNMDERIKEWMINLKRTGTDCRRICLTEKIIMLKIYLGNMENAIYHPPTYFDNRYQDEWITNELSIRMIKAVDKSDVISSHLIQSPVLGPISIKELSGSVKTLMLMVFDQSGNVFNASVCGDDCAKWILSIAKTKDLTINHKVIFDYLFKSSYMPV